MHRKKVSQGDRIYKEIKNQIISGHLKPRQKIVEKELAERLEVSRTPIRDCLNKLIAEGLLEKDLNGTFVKDINLKHMMEVYEFRAILEGYVAKTVFKTLTNKDFIELEKILVTQEKHLSNKEYIEAARVGTDFHWFIIEKSNNSLYKKKLRSLFEECERFRNVTFFFENCRRNIIINHQQLINVLKSSDEVAVETKFRKHLFEIRDEIELMNLNAMRLFGLDNISSGI